MIFFDTVYQYHSVKNVKLSLQHWARSSQLTADHVCMLGNYEASYQVAPVHHALTAHHYASHHKTQKAVDCEARLFYQRIQMQQEQVHGASDHLHLSVGVCFFVNERYVVTEIYHIFFFDGDALVYSNQFYAINAAIMLTLPFYQRPITKQPLLATIQLIENSSRLRATISFSWDKNQEMSPFCSVRHYWSGAGYGAQFMPEEGDRVYVDFLEGDLTQPVIMGPSALPSSDFTIGTSTAGIRFSQNDLFFNSKGKFQIRSDGQLIMRAFDAINITAGTLALSAQQWLQLTSQHSLTIKVGVSMLYMKNDQVKLSSEKIRIN